MPSLATIALTLNAAAVVSEPRSSPLDARPRDTRTRSIGFFATSPVASLTVAVLGVNVAAAIATAAADLAAHICRLSRPVGQERRDGALEVLRREELAGELGHDRVGRAGAALLLRLDDLLRRCVGDRW